MTSQLIRALTNGHSKGSPLLLGIGQLFAHLSILYVSFYFSWPLLIGGFVVYYLMTSWGVSVTAHRFLAHHSFGLPRTFEILGSLLFTLSIQGSTITWVAMHREHHRFSDKKGDPHCPRDNFWKVHFLSMFYVPKIKYAISLMRDPFHEWIHRFYWVVNALYSTALYLAVGIDGIVYLHLFPAFLCWHAIGLAKTTAHICGYRNFETGDSSYNLPVLAYLNFGEGWHNNHHAHPTRFSFSHRSFEVDFSAVAIKVGKRILGFRDSFSKSAK